MNSTPRLLAISDLHVRHAANSRALRTLRDHEDDWLIVAGDVGERLDDLAGTLDLLRECFAQVFWVPGNHELWTMDDGLGGVQKYEALVALCRARGVHTPEDPFVVWEGDGGAHEIALLFALYDYSFAPPGLDPAAVVAWAREGGVVAIDELRLSPSPYGSRALWCRVRVQECERRLQQGRADLPRVLVNHWPLRRDLVRIPRVPRYSPWCGTAATEDWHLRHRASVVVSGHLHVRATDWRDGVRFEEVSLGYPRQWGGTAELEGLLREVLPGPARPLLAEPDPVWHALGGPRRRPAVETRPPGVVP